MAVVLAVVAGLVVGVVGTLGIGAVVGRRSRDTREPARSRVTRRRMPAETMLELLPTAAVLVGRSDDVRLANAAAVNLGVVRGQRVALDELRRLVRRARVTGRLQKVELSLSLGDFPRRAVTVGARAEPLPDGDVALVVDDLTEAKRVESVRRDFVANVGHEIKTPVGALALLAEAAQDAGDDPAAVRRFVARIQHEAERLSRLVQELLDLSRLQGGEPLPDLARVSVDAVLHEAADRARPVADARRIELVVGGTPGLSVMGSERQLATAVSNLIDNAVAYSGEGTRVAVAAGLRDEAVEIAVSDQGIGIDAADQQRIFERFYRVDPARSRETGGTGLGLAIVKHIVGNHGGEITVWSRIGAGSTFTIRLPQAPDETEEP